WRVTSGPIPSPGRSSTFLFDGMIPLIRIFPGSEPGLALLALLLEARNRLVLFQGQADLVQALQQAALLERIDLETDGLAVGPGDGLLFEVDGDAGVRPLARVVHQLGANPGRQRDRQHAVLEAVGVEDVGEARRDHGADAEIEERPGRVLARGTA